ncbi:MAG: GspE/PulE family protein [Planctomycetota bacterium]
MTESSSNPVLRGERGWNAPSGEFLARVPRELCRRHLVIGAGRRDGAELLRVGSSTPPWIPGNVAVAIGLPVQVAFDEPDAIARDVDRHYPASQSAEADGGTADLTGEEDAQAEAAKLLSEADRDLLRIEGKGPVVRLVDLILFDALSRKASDVHIQPLADRTLVRYRLDGVLHDVRDLAAVLAASVVTRIKVMSRMDVAERGAPQDGRATVTIGSGARGTPRSIDLRVSTLPTSYGERAVIRLLDNSRDQHLIDLAQIGMDATLQAALVERLNRAHGIVLVTGPTGSGKTTSLYASLRLIATPDKGKASGEYNIMTIEDPIEYELSTVGIAVSQTQVNLKKGLTFATGLRHILRQDPDVVMVGEIRDEETARIAMQASLTGHLVLSTLHTNDAASAVTRLVDLGIEPYLVSASLSAVLAQRLVRRVHSECSGAGCEGCLNSGYRGRFGVFEMLTVTDRVRELISSSAGEQTIRQTAQALGMRTLMEEGRRLAELGTTTMTEVQRVIQGI